MRDFIPDTCADHLDFDGEKMLKLVNRNQIYCKNKSGTFLFTV